MTKPTHRAKIRAQSQVDNDRLLCHQCGQTHPRTDEFFYYDPRQGKHYPPCRPCKRKQVKAYKQRKKDKTA